MALTEELGRPMRPGEVAQYLGVDEGTVRRYYRTLGGIRLGNRYIFFEKEVINAVQARRQMESTGQEGRKEDRGDLPDEAGGHRMGNPNAKAARRKMVRDRVADPHGLFG